MNTEAEFIRAIAASPHDQLLLGAFGDWLEEQGDRRAAWVRSPAVRPWMGPTFEDPIPKMIDSLRGKKNVMDVRRAAAVIGAPIVPELAGLLSHQDGYVRQQAIHCFRNIGKAAAGAVPALLEALKDRDRGVRELAA